jgi:hypothetical protein
MNTGSPSQQQCIKMKKSLRSLNLTTVYLRKFFNSNLGRLAKNINDLFTPAFEPWLSHLLTKAKNKAPLKNQQTHPHSFSVDKTNNSIFKQQQRTIQ